MVERGQRIEVRDATGTFLPRRALGGVIDGSDFPVVWACREDEWLNAESEGRDPEGTPWPAEDVRVGERVTAS